MNPQIVAEAKDYHYSTKSYLYIFYLIYTYCY